MAFWPIFFDFDILDPFSRSKSKFGFILLVKIFPFSMQLVDLLRPYLLISLGHHHPFMSLSFLLFSTSLIHHLSSSLRFWPYFYPISFPVKPSHTGAYFTPKWLFYYLHIRLWFITALAPLISFWFRSRGGRHMLSSLIFHLSNTIYHLCPKCSVLSLSGWSCRICYLFALHSLDLDLYLLPSWLIYSLM